MLISHQGMEFGFNGVLFVLGYFLSSVGIMAKPAGLENAFLRTGKRITHYTAHLPNMMNEYNDMFLALLQPP